MSFKEYLLELATYVKNRLRCLFCRHDWNYAGSSRWIYYCPKCSTTLLTSPYGSVLSFKEPTPANVLENLKKEGSLEITQDTKEGGLCQVSEIKP